MTFRFENLDGKTRQFMADEVQMDLKSGNFYESPRLKPTAKADYERLIKQAVDAHDAAWLASQILSHQLLNSHEERRKPSGGVTMAKVPSNAHETLAEGEFNRYYARGLCRNALAEKIPGVIVYRAKQVTNPRAESEAMLGKKVDPQSLLDDLRASQGVEPALGLPPGPNSGLSIKLP